mgnify:CR=1 FL=1
MDKNMLSKGYGNDMVKKEIEVLKLFVDRIERLLRSRLTQHILQHQIGCKIFWEEGKNIKIEYPQCDEDDCYSFILSLRFFIQNNDEISIEKISNLIERLPLSNQIKEPFKHNREELSRYLDSPPFCMAFGEPKSYRDLFNTFIYGDLAHLNENLRSVYSRWLKDPLVWPHMQTQFFMVLQNFLLCLSAFRNVALMAIEELER